MRPSGNVPMTFCNDESPGCERKRSIEASKEDTKALPSDGNNELHHIISDDINGYEPIDQYNKAIDGNNDTEGIDHSTKTSSCKYQKGADEKANTEECENDDDIF